MKGAMVHIHTFWNKVWWKKDFSVVYIKRSEASADSTKERRIYLSSEGGRRYLLK
jgi:hypothetical protein